MSLHTELNFLSAHANRIITHFEEIQNTRIYVPSNIKFINFITTGSVYYTNLSNLLKDCLNYSDDDFLITNDLQNNKFYLELLKANNELNIGNLFIEYICKTLIYKLTLPINLPSFDIYIFNDNTLQYFLICLIENSYNEFIIENKQFNKDPFFERYETDALTDEDNKNIANLSNLYVTYKILLNSWSYLDKNKYIIFINLIMSKLNLSLFNFIKNILLNYNIKKIKFFLNNNNLIKYILMNLLKNLINYSFNINFYKNLLEIIKNENPNNINAFILNKNLYNFYNKNKKKYIYIEITEILNKIIINDQNNINNPENIKLIEDIIKYYESFESIESINSLTNDEQIDLIIKNKGKLINLLDVETIYSKRFINKLCEIFYNLYISNQYLENFDLLNTLYLELNAETKIIDLIKYELNLNIKIYDKKIPNFMFYFKEEMDFKKMLDNHDFSHYYNGIYDLQNINKLFETYKLTNEYDNNSPEFYIELFNYIYKLFTSNNKLKKYFHIKIFNKYLKFFKLLKKIIKNKKINYSNKLNKKLCELLLSLIKENDFEDVLEKYKSNYKDFDDFKNLYFENNFFIIIEKLKNDNKLIIILNYLINQLFEDINSFAIINLENLINYINSEDIFNKSKLNVFLLCSCNSIKINTYDPMPLLRNLSLAAQKKYLIKYKK